MSHLCNVLRLFAAERILLSPSMFDELLQVTALFSVTPVSSMSGGWFFSGLGASSVFETFTNRVAADEK